MALELFKARLKAKYSGVNLSKDRITAIADRLHKKFPDLTEETDHDAKLDELNELTPFDEIAKSDDKIRTLEAKTKGQPQTTQTQQTDNTQQQPSTDEDVPKWAKSLMETVSKLSEEKQTQSMQQKLSANEKLKGIDAKLYARWQLPKTDEEIDAFADEVVSTYGHYVPKEGGEQQTVFVPGQQRQPATGKGKVDADIVKFAQSKNEQAKTQKV